MSYETGHREYESRARLTRDVLEFAIVVALLAILFRPLAIVVAVLWSIRLVRRSLRDVFEPALREHWTREEFERRRPETRCSPAAPGGFEQESDQRARKLSSRVARELRDPVRNARELVRRMGEEPGAPHSLDHAREALSELDRVERSIAHLLHSTRNGQARGGSR